MVILSVLYPKSGESRFDHEYYLQNHIPLVKSLWSAMGLVQVELLRCTSALSDTCHAFEMIGHLTFSSLEAVEEALAQAGAEVMADIPNFTNVQPLLQINEPLAHHHPPNPNPSHQRLTN